MAALTMPASSRSTPSPMILSDRLLSLAQEAERAGCFETAEHLLYLAHTVFDDPDPMRH